MKFPTFTKEQIVSVIPLNYEGSQEELDRLKEEQPELLVFVRRQAPMMAMFGASPETIALAFVSVVYMLCQQSGQIDELERIAALGVPNDPGK